MNDQAMVVAPVMQIRSILDIPGCSFQQRGLILDDDLSFDHWERVGQVLQTVEQGVMWWIGDWLNYGERKWGEKYAQAVDVTGYKEGVLRNAVFVAARFPLSRRRDKLPFSYHQDVAGLEPEDQDELLDLVEREGLKRRDLRTRVQVRQVEQRSKPDSRFFDSDLEAAKIEFAPLKAAVISFIERYPRFQIYGSDFIGDIEEEFKTATEDPLEYILSKHDRGIRSWIGLQQATGYTMDTLKRLVDNLVEQRKLKIVPRGGKTDEARGAVEDVIAAFDDPVGLDYRYKDRVIDADFEDEEGDDL